MPGIAHKKRFVHIVHIYTEIYYPVQQVYSCAPKRLGQYSQTIVNTGSTILILLTTPVTVYQANIHYDYIRYKNYIFLPEKSIPF